MMQLETVLHSYGLNDKQTKVFLACLELGTASVQKIAQKAGFPRSTVYEVLEVLREKRLVNTFQKKHARYFSAEDPEQIVRLAQYQAEMVKEALPQLDALAGKSRKRPTVRFYQGREQIKLVFEEVLAEADSIIGFGSSDDLAKQFGEYWKRFIAQRLARKIYSRTITFDSPKGRERQLLAPKQLRETRLVPPTYPFHGATIIWKHKIAMFSLTGDFIATVIESEQLAKTERAMFENLWERLK